MPRVTHPADDRVFACPGCGEAGGIYEREKPEETRDGRQYRCEKCGKAFDEFEERADQRGGRKRVGPTGDIGQAALDADPDAVGGET